MDEWEAKRRLEEALSGEADLDRFIAICMKEVLDRIRAMEVTLDRIEETVWKL